jgi:hypothetical protein
LKGIAEWLTSIGLSEYAQRFADNAIDLSVVRDLTEEDLKDRGPFLDFALNKFLEIFGRPALGRNQNGAKLLQALSPVA